MSRNNVFKLSGNMALSNSEPYAQDSNQIKQSLRLLKARQNKNFDQYPEQNYNNYGVSYSSKVPQRAQHINKSNSGYRDQQSYHVNYEINPKNHIPSNYKNSSSSYKDALSNHIDSYNSKVKNSYDNPRQRIDAQKKNYYEEEKSLINDRRNKNNQMRTKNYEQPQQIYQYQDYQTRGLAKQTENNRNQQIYKQYNQQPQYEPTIRELNRENKVQIIEYDPSQLRLCRQGCGRKFNPDSIKKHESICKKVFQKKRKQFNVQQHRIVSNQQKKLMKRGQIIDKKIQQMKANQKMPKWKAQSLAFRAGIKQGKDKNYVPTREQQMIINQSKQQNSVRCPYCGRTFNETAGPRHITFCENQSKKAKIRR